MKQFVKLKIFFRDIRLNPKPGRRKANSDEPECIALSSDEDNDDEDDESGDKGADANGEASEESKDGNNESGENASKADDEGR